LLVIIMTYLDIDLQNKKKILVIKIVIIINKKILLLSKLVSKI